MSKIIVFATPVFLLLVALEFVLGRVRARKGTGHDTYALGDAMNSISLGIMSQLTGALSKLLSIGIYTLVFGVVGGWGMASTTAFWNTGYGVLLALVFYDFLYYWNHRAGHVVQVFWAAHVVHHQSQYYNLSTALRQPISYPLLGWIFYIPMALAGVPPATFLIVGLIDLLYQFWVHTEQVRTLGWFDRWFCSPSNHRVHHAVNTQYLDKNYGGILMLWDHLFGSFIEEGDPCVYGTRGPLNSWDPLWANFEVYAAMARDSWRTRYWGDKLRVWLKPPGWQPADLAQAEPKPEFQLAAVTVFKPPLTGLQQCFVAIQFSLALAAVSVYLWQVDDMPWMQAAMGSAAISLGLWATGRYMQGSLSLLEVLTVESAALATISAVGLLEPQWHLFFKPLTMVIAIIFVAARGRSMRLAGRLDAFLLGALVFSLGGDVFLMLPGDWFVPGLASFLVAHGFYIALFRQGQGWFANRPALAAVLAAGAGMYALVWQGLGADTGLQIAVAAYVTVIALMVAQALGRATERGDAASRWVATGAGLFMASDSLIAIDKFVTPIPLAPLWILAAYYAAQMLMVHNARPTGTN